MRKLLLTLFVVSAISISISAVDLTGAWTLTLDPDFSGNPSTQNCTLKHDGSTLTLTCEGFPISGEIKDRGVTFKFKTGPDGRNNVTATMTGVLDRAETTIKGTWHLEPNNTSGKFDLAKR